jgi:hypothetical protein
MARDPGEWYEERRELADHLDFAVHHLQAYLRQLDNSRRGQGMRATLTVYLERLVRELEQARYVGD